MTSQPITTSSDSTTHDLYSESLEESLAAAWEYVAKKSTPTLDKPDPANLLHIELTQQKQFELIMQKNSALIVAMVKGKGGGGSGSGGGNGSGGSGGGGGRGGSGGDSGNKGHD